MNETQRAMTKFGKLCPKSFLISQQNRLLIYDERLHKYKMKKILRMLVLYFWLRNLKLKSYLKVTLV